MIYFDQLFPSSFAGFRFPRLRTISAFGIENVKKKWKSKEHRVQLIIHDQLETSGPIREFILGGALGYPDLEYRRSSELESWRKPIRVHNDISDTVEGLIFFLPHNRYLVGTVVDTVPHVGISDAQLHTKKAFDDIEGAVSWSFLLAELRAEILRQEHEDEILCWEMRDDI